MGFLPGLPRQPWDFTPPSPAVRAQVQSEQDAEDARRIAEARAQGLREFVPAGSIGGSAPVPPSVDVRLPDDVYAFTPPGAIPGSMPGDEDLGTTHRHIAEGPGAGPMVPNSPLAPPPMLRPNAFPGVDLKSMGITPPAEGEGGIGTPAKAPVTSNPIRALKLPNGKVIFTNVGNTVPGAKEISTRDAGRDIRARDAAKTAGMMMEGDETPDLSPTGMPSGFNTVAGGGAPGPMSDLMRASVGQEWRRMRGENVPEGSFLISSGTPEIQDRLEMETGQRELEKAQLAQNLATAKLPPRELAAMGNQTIQSGNFAIDRLLPLYTKALQDSDKAMAALSDPNTPMDPQQRKAAAAQVQARVNAIKEVLNLAMGQRAPQMF